MTGATLPPESLSSKAPNSHSHKGSPKLEDHAATAAFYVMQPEDTSKAAYQVSLSNRNQRLSTAGAATSLKYADLRDLPSFPSLGLSNGPSCAGTAASLASSSHKPTSLWKADRSASAFAAAALAKDFKSTKPWQPEPSAYGAKAALLAHARNPVEISPSGNSTSPQSLLQNQGLNPRPNHGYTPAGKGSLQPTTAGAVVAKRRRSGSAPTITSTWPDSEKSAANALNAATTAHSPSAKKTIVLTRGLQSTNKTNSMPLDFSRIHSAARENVTRARANTHIVPAQEPVDRKRADVRAAAVSMARQFFAVQQGGDGSQQAANRASPGPPSGPSAQAGEQTSMNFNSLEEAANKLASERLAKLHNEHEAYRNCYRVNQAQPPLPIRGKTRRRAVSVGQCTSQDEEQSRKIRSEMSLLTDQVVQVDAKKMERDCTALIATAHKNVQASMHKMDEKILSDTGRLTPSMQEEWEAKAIAAAEAESKVRMSNYGKIDVGGGRFIDQKEVDAAAAKNVQPLLNEINERAEKERANQEEIRLEEEKKRRITEEERLLERELKRERKRAKALEKLDERVKKVEQKRLWQEGKKQSRRAPAKPAGYDRPAAASLRLEVKRTSVTTPPETDHTILQRDEGLVLDAPVEEDPTQSRALGEGHTSGEVSPVSPVPGHKVSVKKWLKEKFSKQTNKGRGAGANEDGNEETSREGATLAELDSMRRGSSEGSDSSVREVAIVGRDEPSLCRGRNNQGYSTDEEGLRGNRRHRGSVSISPVSGNEENRLLSYPRRRASSRDNRYESARHTFDDETAPAITSGTHFSHVCKRSVHDSKFIENL